MKTYIALLIFYAIIFSSCATQNKFEKMADKHPEWLAEKCTEKYPPQEKYIKGKDSIITVTESRTDSVIVTQVVNGKTTYVKVPCPACNQNTRTIYRTDTIQVVDSAKVYLANKKVADIRTKLTVTQSDRDRYKKHRNVTWLILLLTGVIFGAVKILPKLF